MFARSRVAQRCLADAPLAAPRPTGNINIGEGAQIAAGSLVLKPVPPRTMVAGSPAREVGQVRALPGGLGRPSRPPRSWVGAERGTAHCRKADEVEKGAVHD